MFFKREDKDWIEVLRRIGLPIDNNGWWVRYPKRAIEEMAKMAEGSGSILKINRSKMIFEEWITTNFGTRFLISIEAEGYPHKIPKVYVKEPKIKESKHRWKDGSLCLMESSEYSSRTSILQIRNLASAWCFCYEVYFNTNEWPAAEH